MNLLVLKFLTMNTDDERREEFSREAQRTHSLRFSNSDIVNLANGNTLCTFKTTDLEDLRRENNFSLGCLNRLPFLRSFRNKIMTPNEISIEFQEDKQDFTRNQNSFSVYKHSNQRHECENESYCCCFYVSSTSSNMNQLNLNGKANIPASYGLKKRRKHYTIRRAPGMISHLLSPERTDSVFAPEKLKEININLKSEVFVNKTKDISTNFTSLHTNDDEKSINTNGNVQKIDFKSTEDDNPEINFDQKNLEMIKKEESFLNNHYDNNIVNEDANYKNITYV